MDTRTLTNLPQELKTYIIGHLPKDCLSALRSVSNDFLALVRTFTIEYFITVCIPKYELQKNYKSVLHTRVVLYELKSCYDIQYNKKLEIELQKLDNDINDISSVSHTRICTASAKIGALNTLQYALTKKCLFNEETYTVGAIGGHINIIKLLQKVERESDDEWMKLTQSYKDNYYTYSWDNTYTCAETVKHGHLQLLIYLHESGCGWDKFTCRWAVLYNQFNILKWLKGDGIPKLQENEVCYWTEDEICNFAARSGNLDMLKYVNSKGCKFDKNTMIFATEKGSLEMVKWLYDKGCLINERKCATACAKGGQIDILYWLREKNTNTFNWDYSTCQAAAENGHLNILKYAIENGCDQKPTMCLNAGASNGSIDIMNYLAYVINITTNMYISMYVEAVTHGHIHILDWLYDKTNNLFDTISLCAHASQNGHLEVVKWLHNKNCVWDETTCEYASLSGHIDILKYAIDNGCPYSWNTTTIMGVLNNNDFELIKIVKPFSTPKMLQECVDKAIRCGNISLLKSLKEDGFPYNHKKCVELATQEGQLYMLQFLMNEDPSPEHWSEIYNILCENYCVSILKWAIKKNIKYTTNTKTKLLTKYNTLQNTLLS